MASSLGLSEKTLWLLSIIDSTPHIDGDTRLQKYGLLVSKIALENQKTYDDWDSNHFGAYSQEVMVDTKYLLKNNYIQAFEMTTYHGDQYNRYSLTEKGKKEIQPFKKQHSEIISKIKSITSYYFNKSLNELLVDAYTLFPEYTKKSKIKALVRKTFLERDSKLGSKYELPYTQRKIDLSAIVSPVKVNPFMFNDQDIREEISKKAGLKEIPPLDMNAFDELEDIFADKTYLTNVNVSKILKEIRMS